MLILIDFPPAQLFQHIYYPVLDRIQIDRPEVQRLFCEQVSRNKRTSTDAATSHRAVLSQLAKFLQVEFNNKVCLSCLGRPAGDSTLDCGHSLCDSCIVIHGRRIEEWSIALDTCPLCGMSNSISFLRKPSSAGVRVLSISGNLGEAFALSFLEELRVELQLPGLHLGDIFDIAVGTGSGSYGLG